MRFIACLVLLASCGEVVKGADADLCTGTCECRLDTDCGSHEFCNDQSTSRTCECVAGYTNPGAGCAFTGVVANPGFQSAASWTTDPAVMIDENLNVAGFVDPGAARFHNDSLCKLQRIHQTVTMPRLSRAEPFVMEITYRYIQGGEFSFTPPAFGLGAVWHDDLDGQSNMIITRRTCLGAASYAPESSTGKGTDLPLTVMPVNDGQDCQNPVVFFDVDHVEVKPANPDECAAPGTALNGDAEGTTGWTFATEAVAGDTSTAKLEPGVGEANTRGARLFQNIQCTDVSLSNQISIPDAAAMPSPSIQVFNRTSSGGIGAWSMANVTLPNISGSGTGTTLKMCVPPFMRGGVFFLDASVFSQICSQAAVNIESVYDNLKVVNEPTCGTDTAIADPGFESSLLLIGAFSTPGKSLARTLQDPAQAHTGNGALQLSVTQLCDGPSWSATLVTPSTSGTSGPALTFFYKAPPAISYQLTVSSRTGSFQPILDNQWHQGSICLDPTLIERVQSVNFRLTGGLGACANSIPAEQAFVDDLAVTTDPSCTGSPLHKR